MPRIRTVKPEFFSHEGLAALPFAARLLAIGLLQIADGEGRMRWIPKQIEAHVFPFDVVDLDDLAEGLEGAGFLLRYADGARLYATIPNFRKHQRITGREASYESKVPAPDACASRGNGGETPERFPGKQVGAQEQGNRGTGEQGNREERAQGALVLAAPDPADPVLTVWAGYVEGRANQRKAPGKDARRDIAARLKADATVEDLVLVSRWVLSAPDWYCGKQRESGNTTYSTIYKAKGMEDRIDKARAWRDGGAVKAPAGQVPGLTDEQRIAAQRKYAWQRDELVARMEAAPDIAALPEITLPRLDSLLGTLVRAEPVPEWLRAKWVIGMDRRRVELQERIR